MHTQRVVNIWINELVGGPLTLVILHFVNYLNFDDRVIKLIIIFI